MGGRRKERRREVRQSRKKGGRKGGKEGKFRENKAGGRGAENIILDSCMPNRNASVP